MVTVTLQGLRLSSNINSNIVTNTNNNNNNHINNNIFSQTLTNSRPTRDTTNTFTSNDINTNTTTTTNSSSIINGNNNDNKFCLLGEGVMPYKRQAPSHQHKHNNNTVTSRAVDTTDDTNTHQQGRCSRNRVDSVANKRPLISNDTRINKIDVKSPLEITITNTEDELNGASPNRNEEKLHSQQHLLTLTTSLYNNNNSSSISNNNSVITTAGSTGRISKPTLSRRRHYHHNLQELHHNNNNSSTHRQHHHTRSHNTRTTSTTSDATSTTNSTMDEEYHPQMEEDYQPHYQTSIPVSPVSPASPFYENPTSPISPDGGRRGGDMKHCGVCGDVAKSMHFGGLSCDSCKAFFRRSVQNNAYKAFACPYERKCTIAKTSRKACQYCRFQKCVSIGMEKSWVMGEDERRAKMEQRRERRGARPKHGSGIGGGAGASSARVSSSATSLALAPSPAVTSPVPANTVASAASSPVPSLEEFKLPDNMTGEIEMIEAHYKKSSQEIQYSSKDGTPIDPRKAAAAAMKQHGSKAVIGTWMIFCKKIGHFFSLFSDFSSLDEVDQTVLLQTAMTSAGIIMGSAMFEYWSSAKGDASGTPSPIPQLSLENIQRIVPGDLFFRVQSFFKKFRLICPDQTMAKILILVALYSPELSGLKDEKRVQELQEHYINILECYIKYKYKEKSGHMFAKALVSLADVRELAERSLEIEINKSMIGDSSSKNNSDHSSGGNDGERKGSGGGSFGGPSTSGGGNDGGPSGVGDLKGTSSSSSTGLSERRFGSYGNDSSGGSGSDNGSCGDAYSVCPSVERIGLSMHDNDEHTKSVTRYSTHSLCRYDQSSDLTMGEQKSFVDSSQEPSLVDSIASCSLHAKQITKRQFSDQRIQQLFKSIPPPAVMKIICALSNHLDIETKEIDGGLKFLKKHRHSFSSDKQNALFDRRRNFSSSSTIKMENSPIDCSTETSFPCNFSGVSIKEEKMDVDSWQNGEMHAINEMLSEIESGVTTTNSSPASFFESESSTLMQQNSTVSVIGNGSELLSYGMHGSAKLESLENDISGDYHRRIQVRRLHRNNCAVRSRNGFERTSNTSRSRRQFSNKSSSNAPLSLQQDIVSSSNGGNNRYETSSYNPRFSSTTSADLSTVATRSLQSPLESQHSHSVTPSYQFTSIERNGGQCIGITSDVSPSITASCQPISPVSFATLNSSGKSPSCLPTITTQPTSPYSTSASGNHITSSVNQQIMAMSIHSPDSPTYSNNNSNSGVPTDVLSTNQATHFTGYFTHLPSRTSLSPHQAQGMNHQLVSTSVNESIAPTFTRHTSNNKDYYHRRDFGSLHESTTNSIVIPQPPSTPSPSPSTISAHSSSSCSNHSFENSSDYFDKSLHSNPLNLSCLSDVQAAVLQQLFEHVNTQMSLEVHEGTFWKNEDLLPKPFLEKLQDELKTE